MPASIDPTLEGTRARRRTIRIAALPLFVLLFAPPPSAGDTSTSLGSSGGEGSGPFGGLAQSPEANLFTGAMSLSVQILVPPGRKNTTPKLDLVYSSAAGDGPFGHGWDVPLGSVERSTKNGVPRCQAVGGFDHRDDFVLNLSGAAHELVPYPSAPSNVYRAKVDEGFVEAYKNAAGNGWEVVDRAGNRYRFGTDPAARLWAGQDVFLNASTCSFTAVWALTEIEDPNGNVIQIAYVPRVGAYHSLVPSQVSYGEQAGSANQPFRVRFLTIAHPNPRISFRRGVPEELDLLVNQIVVEWKATEGGGYGNVRTVNLDYDHEAAFASCDGADRPLLCRVTAPLEPTRTFEYAPSAFALGNQTVNTGSPDGANNLRNADMEADVFRSVMDMNGDGALDLVVANGLSGAWLVHRSFGSAGTLAWSRPSGVPARMRLQQTNNGVVNVWTETVDLTGDGLPDYVDAQDLNGTLEPWEVYEGSCGGSGPCEFLAPFTWSAPEEGIQESIKQSNGTEIRTWKRLIDMNGDGRPDLLTADATRWYLHLNTGSSFAPADPNFLGLPGFPLGEDIKVSGAWETRRDLFDFNGDGLPDAIRQSGASLTLHLNNGRTIETAGIPLAVAGCESPIRTVDESSGVTRTDFLDVNADGLPDRVYSTCGAQWQVQLNLGTALDAPLMSWGSHGSIRDNNDGSGRTKIDMVDWNGDGFLDRVDATTASWTVKLGRPVDGLERRPRLLVRAHSGLGGITDVRYEPSTNAGITLLPFVSWVTTGIRRTDGLCQPPNPNADLFDPAQNSCIGAGHELVRTMVYYGGLFDGESREFRGFERVDELYPADGNHRRVTFSQDDFTRGKILTDELRWGTGTNSQLVREEIFMWATQADGPRTQLYQAAHEVNEPEQLIVPGVAEGQCLLNRNESPDVHGRVGATCSLDCANDTGTCTGNATGQVTTVTTWADPIGDAASGETAVWERPATVLTRYVNASGTPETLTEKKFRYDSLPDAQVDEGNLTEAETVLVSGSNPVASSTYDAYGNVTGVTNPRGHVSTSSFTGTPFDLYPSSEANALGHTVGKVWDLRFGKPTQISGPNVGEVTTYAYDGLGRTTCEALPGDSCAPSSGFIASAKYQYVYGNPQAATYEQKLSYVAVQRREPDHPNGYLESRTYYDALGRVRLSTEPRVLGADTTPSTVVLNQTDYDGGGRVLRTFVSYVQVGTLVENPGVSVTFRDYYEGFLNPDPLNRVLRIDPPDHREIRKSYDGAWTRVTDPAGNVTITKKDAFGRVVTRELYEGASTLEMRFDYEYDGLNRARVNTVYQNPGSGIGPVSVARSYNRLGEPSQVVDPDSGTWTYTYDANGNLIHQNDPVPNQHVQMCYDALDRVTLRCLYKSTDAYDPSACSTGCVGANVEVESIYFYDETQDETQGCGGKGLGRLTSVADLSGGECNFYDERGRLTQTRKTVFDKQAVTRFWYNAADRITTIEYPGPRLVGHSYQQDGKLDVVGDAVDGIEYDVFGRVQRLLHRNGTEDAFGYYGEVEGFRLETVEALRSSDGTRYLDLAYAYGPRGKIEQITDHRNPSDDLSNDALYGYDGLGRLTDVDWNQGAATYDESFAYNPLGNITQKGVAGASSSFSYAPSTHKATAYGSFYSSITYDGSGQRKTKQKSDSSGQRYTYDSLGRMTKTELLGSGGSVTTAVDYVYDYTGRRVSKTVNGASRRRYFSRYAESQNGFLFRYWYAGDRLIVSSYVSGAAWSDAAPGVIPAPPELWLPPPFVSGAFGVLVGLSLLGFGRRRVRVGMALSLSRNLGMALVLVTCSSPVLLGVTKCKPKATPFHHYHLDHLGSVQAISNHAGALVRQIRYRAYGEIRGRFDASGGPVTAIEEMRREFTGYETEIESALEYAGARFYDPEFGQFLTHDPARQFASPYAYGPWDPLNGTDPNGELFGIDDAILFWIAVALIVASAAYTYVRTGDAGLALKSLGYGFAGLAVGMAIGPLIGSGIQAIADVSQTAAQAIRFAQVGYAGYGVYGSIESGNPFAALQAGLGMAAAAEGFAKGFGDASTAEVVNGQSHGATDDSTVQIDYYPLQASPAAGAAGATHATATVLNPDPNGPDFFVEGGADGVPGGSASASAAVGAASGSGSLGNVNAIGQFGRTPANFGRTPVASQMVRVPLSFAKAVHGAQQYVNAVNAAGVPYNPFGPNSNTVAHSLTPFLGGVRPPPAAWAPGSREAFPFP